MGDAGEASYRPLELDLNLTEVEIAYPRSNLILSRYAYCYLDLLGKQRDFDTKDRTVDCSLVRALTCWRYLIEDYDHAQVLNESK